MNIWGWLYLPVGLVGGYLLGVGKIIPGLVISGITLTSIIVDQLITGAMYEFKPSSINVKLEKVEGR